MTNQLASSPMYRRTSHTTKPLPIGGPPTSRESCTRGPLAHSCFHTQITRKFISLLSGYGYLSQGGDSIYGGFRLQMVLWGPNWPNRERFLTNLTCQYKIRAGKLKKYHQQTLLGPQKSIFLSFHEFPKMMATYHMWPSFPIIRDFLPKGPQNTCI